MTALDTGTGGAPSPPIRGPKGLFLDLLLKQILPFKGKAALSRTLEQQHASRDGLTRRMERLVAQSRRVNDARHLLVVERRQRLRGWPRLRWRGAGRGGAWATWESVQVSLSNQTPSLRRWYADVQTHVVLLNGMAAIGAAMTKQLQHAHDSITQLENQE